MNPFFKLQKTHLVLTQYYRWYQVYEVPFTEKRIENQKGILSEDVEIVSMTGTAKGVEGLENRLKVYNGWLNAHHVQQIAVEVLLNNQYSLEADILYQNIRPDNSKHSYTIHYSALLESKGNALPLFTRLELKPTGEVKEFRFETAYPVNRVKSFLHYWFYLLETSKGNTEPFKELLTKDFSLKLGETTNTFPKLEETLKKLSAQRTDCTHSYKNLKVEEPKKNTFHVSVDVERTTINLNDETIKEEIHQEWVLENNMDERFARMKKMTVSEAKFVQTAV